MRTTPTETRFDPLGKLLPMILALAAAAVASPASAQYNPRNLNTTKIMNQLHNPTSDLVLVAAHRGYHGLEGSSDYADVPENSRAAIRTAANKCAEIVELDVRLSSDGQPILTHDERWGREALVGVDPYRPSTWYNPHTKAGNNPRVDQTSAATARAARMRNANGSQSLEYVPTLADALAYIQQQGYVMVIALDVKEPAALRAAWRKVLQYGMWNRVFFKIGAAHYPSAHAFAAEYSTNEVCSYTFCGAAYADSHFIKIMPVYNTEYIKPGNSFGSAGGENKLSDSIDTYFNYRYTFTVGIEFNIKNYGGILYSPLRRWANKQDHATIANFNPYREYTGRGRNEYYNSDGSCCSELSRYWFNGQPYGLPSDTTDRRTQMDFLIAESQEFGLHLITTDNVDVVRSRLGSEGLRNTSRIKN